MACSYLLLLLLMDIIQQRLFVAVPLLPAVLLWPTLMDGCTCCYYWCRVLVPQLPQLLQLAWSAAAAAAPALSSNTSNSSSSRANASLGFLIHLVRAHSELRQLDRLLKAVFESMAGLMAAAAAAAPDSSGGGGSQGFVEQQAAAAAAAGVVSAVGFVAAVRQAVADAPTGEALEEECVSTRVLDMFKANQDMYALRMACNN
jgi:hypothetical protein